MRHVGNVVAHFGDTLRAGQFIICGSVTAPMFLETDESGVDFALQPVGAISVKFGA